MVQKRKHWFLFQEDAWQLTVIWGPVFERRGWWGQSSGRSPGGQVHHHGASLGIAQERWLPSQLQADAGHDSQERAPTNHCIHMRHSWPTWEGEKQKVGHIKKRIKVASQLTFKEIKIDGSHTNAVFNTVFDTQSYLYLNTSQSTFM